MIVSISPTLSKNAPLELTIFNFLAINPSIASEKKLIAKKVAKIILLLKKIRMKTIGAAIIR